MQRVMMAFSVSLLATGLALAQTSQNSWDNLKQFQPGQKIQVVDMDWKSFKGKLVGVTDEAISLRVKKEEVTVERDNVLRVTDRGHAERGRNMLIGGAIGAGVGLALGAVADRGAGGSSVEHLGKGLGLVVGGGAGIGLGAACPHYQTIYRTKRRQ